MDGWMNRYVSGCMLGELVGGYVDGQIERGCVNG